MNNKIRQKKIYCIFIKTGKSQHNLKTSIIVVTISTLM